MHNLVCLITVCGANGLCQDALDMPSLSQSVLVHVKVLGCAVSVCPSSQWHALPNREYMHFNSELIILNNDQHQHQKIISTNNRIKSKIKQQHTTSVNWCYCLIEVLFQKVYLFVVHKFAGMEKLAKQARGIE